jgi:hypothetical protein
MKHRTVAVFVVGLALMGAVSQGIQKLSDLSDAAGKRLSAGLWNAVLGLHGQKVAGVSNSRELVKSSFVEGQVVETASVKSESEGRSASSPKSSAKSSEQYDSRQAEDDFDLAEDEIELAHLKALDEVFDLESVSNGHIMIRVPEAPLPNGAPTPQPFVFDREKVRELAHGYRALLRTREVKRESPKVAAPPAAPAKAATSESRWTWESTFKTELLNSGANADAKTGAKDCELTNE